MSGTVFCFVSSKQTFVSELTLALIGANEKPKYDFVYFVLTGNSDKRAYKKVKKFCMKYDLQSQCLMVR